MLHRSFKPAKCKTALKLAVSRIKLLKNKKDAQVKQIKRELAQLIETGQYRTARIRVEHVLREEKTKAAYELIEIYCELIAARLPMIESQKNCPIDLKEAITSVVFASPRCADVPELMDVRKHFTAKYGKEFITGAVELRPDCGVSRMLVEKLSPKSPDGPTKMKILAAIAEEHNVKWDPESFEEKESRPPEDLLNGPNTLSMASRIPVEPPRGPLPPNHDVKEPSNVQVPPQSYENHDVSMNINQPSTRSSPHSWDSASSDVYSNEATVSDTFHPEVRSSGNASSTGTQSWNMNFKDAASAAQAAAESAEMASMAARAAAELSRQHSLESRDKVNQSASSSSSRTSINNGPSVNSHQMANRYPQKNSSEPEKRDSMGEVSTKRQSSNTEVYSSEMQTGIKPDNVSYFGDVRSEEKSSTRSSQSISVGEVSRKGQSSNPDVYSSEMQTGMKPDNVSYFGDVISEEKSSRRSSQSNSIGKVSTKRLSSNTDVYVNEMQTGMKPDNTSYFGDMRYEEKSSRPSSQSNSSFGSDDQEDVLRGNDHISYLGDMRTGEHPVRSSSYSHSRNSSNDHGNVSIGLGEDFFVSDSNIYQSTKQTNSYENAAALVFDDSGSDDEKSKFDVDYKGQVSSFYFPSPDRNSFAPSAHLDAWSSKQQTDEVQFKTTSRLSSSSVQHSPPVFSENLTGSTDSSQPNDLFPVAFDASDGPSSDSEEELDKSKLSQSTVSKFSSGLSQSASHRSFGSSFSKEINMGSHGVQPKRSQGVKNSTVSEEKFDYDELPTGQPSPRPMKSGLDSNVEDIFQRPQLSQTMKDSEVSEGCSCASDTDNELNYGILKGGLRNKGYSHPPYTRKPSGNSLFVKQVTEATKIEQPSYSLTVRTSTVSGTTSQEPYNLQGSTKLMKERSRRTQVSYVASDDDSSEDELSHGTVSSSQDLYNKKLGSEVKASSKSTFGFFDSEDSEGEEDLLSKISTSNARPSAKLSRRTQPSSLNSVRSSSKTAIVSDVSGTSDYGKASSRSSYATETLPKPSSQTKSSELSGSQAPEPIQESQRSSHVETSKSHRNSSSRSSYAAENISKPLSQTKSSELPGSQEWHAPAEQAAPKPIPESKRFSPVETSKSYGNSSSGSSYATETLPKPLSQTKSLELPGSQEWHGTAEQAAPKSIPESKRFSPVETSKSYGNSSSGSSYATETLPKPSYLTKSSDSQGSPESHGPVERAVRKPLPESKRSSPVETSKSYGNPSSRSSYATETLSKPSSQTKSSERPGNQERHRPVEQAAPKSIPESKRASAHVETSKSFAREQPSNLSPKIARAAGSTETSKPSGSTVDGPSNEKASHVHPMLPDSDDIIAKFMALRQSRQ